MNAGGQISQQPHVVTCDPNLEKEREPCREAIKKGENLGWGERELHPAGLWQAGEGKELERKVTDCREAPKATLLLHRLCWGRPGE